jgi:hypothetical protein
MTPLTDEQLRAMTTEEVVASIGELVDRLLALIPESKEPVTTT